VKHLTYYTGLRPFVVNYHGFEYTKAKKKPYTIELDNMLFKEDKSDSPYSFLDLKMG
jgi:hypothetical protein